MDEKISYQVKSIDVTEFDPRKGNAKVRITFMKNEMPVSLDKEFHFTNAVGFVNSIINDVKKKDNIVTYEDDILSGYQVIDFKDEEGVGEKLLNFFSRLSEKYRMMKKMKDAQKYMRMFDEVKAAKIILE
ncbi:MAG: hypothetical protein AABW87_00845 [Nanoarchaeota archaeon]